MYCNLGMLTSSLRKILMFSSSVTDRTLYQTSLCGLFPAENTAAAPSRPGPAGAAAASRRWGAPPAAAWIGLPPPVYVFRVPLQPLSSSRNWHCYLHLWKVPLSLERASGPSLYRQHRSTIWWRIGETAAQRQPGAHLHAIGEGTWNPRLSGFSENNLWALMDYSSRTGYIYSS